MSYRLASESDRIAAIAPIAGVEKLGAYYQAPERGLPIIHFHGTADLWNPWEGGPTSSSSGFVPRQLPAVEDHIRSWVEANQCQPDPVLKSEVGQAQKFIYSNGKDGSEVVFWKLRGGGHTWPGGRVSRLESTGKVGGYKVGPGVGPVNMDIHAGKEMLEFFEKHSLAPKQ